MRTGMSRAPRSLWSCAMVAAAVGAGAAGSSRACTVDFGATGPAGAHSSTDCLCGTGVLAAAGLIDPCLGLASPQAAGVSAGAVSAQAVVNVSIVDFAFQPAVVNVNQGDTVHWANDGFAPHNAVSTEPPGVFGSAPFDNGGTYDYTFTAPGTYAYQCTVHPFMVGSVVVAAPVPEPAAGLMAVSAGTLVLLRRGRKGPRHAA